MKHVWILNHYANAPHEPGGTRHCSLAYHLNKLGWGCTIIAASVNYLTRQQRLKNGGSFRLQHFGYVTFLWLKTPKYRENSAKRILNIAVYTLRALDPRNKKAINAPDLIVGSSVHPFAGLAASLLAKYYRVPFIFEVRDLWPETLIARGKISPDSIVAQILKSLEKFLYRNASTTVILLPKASEYIKSFGISGERIKWIPNGVDMDNFKLLKPRKKESFDFMYLGAHGISNDLDILLKAYKLFEENHKGRPVRLRMVGDGPEKQKLVKMSKALKINNISFEPPVPKDNIPLLASEADAFVITVRNIENLYRYGVSPNKLYDYMAASRPVIIGISAGNNPVEEVGAGLTVPPGDISALSRAFEQMVSLPKAQRDIMGRVGRKYVEANHDLKTLARNLAAIFAHSLNEYNSS